MAAVVTSVKIDAALKREAQTLFNSLGLNMTTAINLFLNQAVLEQAIPFRVGKPESQMVYTKEEFRQKLEDGRKEIRSGRGVVKTMEELREMESALRVSTGESFHTGD